MAVVPAVYFSANIADGKTTFGASMLCLGPAMLLALIVAGAGVYFIVSGAKEETQMIEVEKEKAILDMVQTRGKVRIADIAIELNISVDEVSRYIYDLVGKQLFTGYVDWQGGVLQSEEAAAMPKGACPNCGGKLELAGKGTVKCPYCGSEIFLP